MSLSEQIPVRLVRQEFLSRESPTLLKHVRTLLANGFVLREQHALAPGQFRIEADDRSPRVWLAVAFHRSDFEEKQASFSFTFSVDAARRAVLESLSA